MTSNRLQNDLEAVVAGLQGELDAEVKVSVHDVTSGLAASVNGREPGWAASIIKVPILVVITREIEEGRLTLATELTVDHQFTLDPTDYVSRLRDGARITVQELLEHMIVASDNEATNVLADHVGVERTNEVMGELGMHRSMLGHLLCHNVPRHASDINPDGSNITCTDDMVTIMRHIYDERFSRLTPGERRLSDSVMAETTASYLDVGAFRERCIKEKRGYIADPEAGCDVHTVGIVDDRLIVCIMLNKVGQKRRAGIGQPAFAYREIMQVLERFTKPG